MSLKRAKLDELRRVYKINEKKRDGERHDYHMYDKNTAVCIWKSCKNNGNNTIACNRTKDEEKKQ